MIDKSLKRKRLEELEDEIHKSWLRDLDRVKEINETKEIIENIISNESIESYFDNNQSDINYFLNKFSGDTISNILRQQYVYGDKGDDHALDLLKNYITLFLRFIDRPQYLPLFENIKEIFDPTKSYYKGTSYGTCRVQNEKKFMSNEYFNVIVPLFRKLYRRKRT
jgi:hypothetical protein